MGRHDDKDTEKFLLREILKKLNGLEEDVEKLKSKSEYHINIDKLDVQQLENLIFRLDSLDIKDLSGTLNIGTNFDVKKNTGKDKSKEKSRHGKKKKDKGAPDDNKEE